jgi:hypothetical protein
MGYFKEATDLISDGLLFSKQQAPPSGTEVLEDDALLSSAYSNEIEGLKDFVEVIEDESLLGELSEFWGYDSAMGLDSDLRLIWNGWFGAFDALIDGNGVLEVLLEFEENILASLFGVCQHLTYA